MTVGGATRECGGGALPPDPVLGEGVCQNVLKEVCVCMCVCVCVCGGGGGACVCSIHAIYVYLF